MAVISFLVQAVVAHVRYRTVYFAPNKLEIVLLSVDGQTELSHCLSEWLRNRDLRSPPPPRIVARANESVV
jgi:hypothetical protein